MKPSLCCLRYYIGQAGMHHSSPTSSGLPAQTAPSFDVYVCFCYPLSSPLINSPLLLPSMAPLSFEERASSGRYDELALLFDENPESLAAVDYRTNFKASSRAWRSGSTKNFTTTFSNVEDPRQELVVNLIGEVCPLMEPS